MNGERAAAAAVLADAARAVAAVVTAGRSADDALAATPPTADRRAVRAVALGAMRWYLRFEPAVVPLLARAPDSSPPLLRALLVVAVHQIERSRNPRESTVAAAVDAARQLGLARAAGAVNAVLRRYLRERDSLLAAIADDPVAQSAHPAWLLDRLGRDWPEDLPAILEANNAHPPMTLRVDLSRTTREAYLERLAADGLTGSAVPWMPTALTVQPPVPVARLPGFAEGVVSVQDASAQLAAHLLAPRDRERVLDACAAPGGKSGALLEIAPGIELTAIDRDAERCRLIDDNLRRLGRRARVIAADLLTWDAAGESFDRILLDAPCSGIGVLRRHPDIRLLRRPTDIAPMAALQRSLLERCWGLLRPGGRLLYATCSILAEENTAVIAAFLASTPSARAADPGVAAAGVPLRAAPVGGFLLPGGEAGGDGFYYACLERTDRDQGVTTACQ